MTNAACLDDATADTWNDPLATELHRLVGIMQALRTPVTGCPWDIEQTFETIAPYTIEEAYEVVDAIERNDMVDLVDELGDLLLQVVFHAQLASEANSFSLVDVIRAINTKMTRRHPHVFGSSEARTAGMVKAQWDAIKREERLEKAQRRAANGLTVQRSHGLLGDVPVALPGLLRAVKLQTEAGKVGFDWNDPRAVIEKIREELDEVEAALDLGANEQTEELGDLLFAVANLARHLNVDADLALRSANAKFVRRFQYIEKTVADSGRCLADVELAEMETLWGEAKNREKVANQPA